MDAAPTTALARLGDEGLAWVEAKELLKLPHLVW
jgi:hypothetical protein